MSVSMAAKQFTPSQVQESLQTLVVLHFLLNMFALLVVVEAVLMKVLVVVLVDIDLVQQPAPQAQ